MKSWKLKAGGNLNLDDEISETLSSLEKKIPKEWYRFEPMDSLLNNDLSRFIGSIHCGPNGPGFSPI